MGVKKTCVLLDFALGPTFLKVGRGQETSQLSVDSAAQQVSAAGAVPQADDPLMSMLAT